VRQPQGGVCRLPPGAYGSVVVFKADYFIVVPPQIYTTCCSGKRRYFLVRQRCLRLPCRTACHAGFFPTLGLVSAAASSPSRSITGRAQLRRL